MLTLKTKYYLSYQDGRIDNVDYDTLEEAESAREDYVDKQGICVMNRDVAEWDSEPETLKHIRRVQEYLGKFAIDLIQRGVAHDASKLGSVEKPHFDRETQKLKELTYGSPEYQASLERLGEALKHHYAANTHHPEHYKHGVAGMTLFDVVEMVADWKAASERNKGGKANLEVSFSRFNFDPQLAQIFRNTWVYMGWDVAE